MNKKVLTITILITVVLAAAVILFLTGMLPGMPAGNAEPPEAPDGSGIGENVLQDGMSFDPEEDFPETDPEASPVIASEPGDRSGGGYDEEPVPPDTLDRDDLSEWNLILVNFDDPIPRDFTVDLTEIGGCLADIRIADALEAMIADAASEGVTLRICSAFRTVKTQQALLDKKVLSLMGSGLDADLAYSAANRFIALPSKSEHHTGLAVDFLTDGATALDEGFAKTGAYTWLTQNAHRYGFILRYPQGKEDITHYAFEPWHFRYIGREHAAAIRKAGLCLEEYLSTAE